MHLATIFFAMIFWAIYQQYTLPVLLYAEKDVDRSLFGWVLSSSSTTALGAVALLLLWLLLTLLWPWLSRRGLHFGDLGKLALSLVRFGLAYLLLAVVVEATEESGKTSMMWIVAFYGFLGFGEILLAPLGLSLTARLAPGHLSGYAVGMWSFSFAAAVYLAGVLAVPQQITGGGTFRRSVPWLWPGRSGDCPAVGCLASRPQSLAEGSLGGCLIVLKPCDLAHHECFKDL